MSSTWEEYYKKVAKEVRKANPTLEAEKLRQKIEEVIREDIRNSDYENQYTDDAIKNAVEETVKLMPPSIRARNQESTVFQQSPIGIKDINALLKNEENNSLKSTKKEGVFGNFKRKLSQSSSRDENQKEVAETKPVSNAGSKPVATKEPVNEKESKGLEKIVERMRSISLSKFSRRSSEKSSLTEVSSDPSYSPISSIPNTGGSTKVDKPSKTTLGEKKSVPPLPEGLGDKAVKFFRGLVGHSKKEVERQEGAKNAMTEKQPRVEKNELASRISTLKKAGQGPTR